MVRRALIFVLGWVFILGPWYMVTGVINWYLGFRSVFLGEMEMLNPGRARDLWVGIPRVRSPS